MHGVEQGGWQRTLSRHGGVEWDAVRWVVVVAFKGEREGQWLMSFGSAARCIRRTYG